MDRNININYFERLLKEKSDDFKMYPSKRVWHSVYNNLYPGQRWPSALMSMILVSSVLMLGYMNTDSVNSENRTQLIGHNLSEEKTLHATVYAFHSYNEHPDFSKKVATFKQEPDGLTMIFAKNIISKSESLNSISKKNIQAALTENKFNSLTTTPTFIATASEKGINEEASINSDLISKPLPISNFDFINDNRLSLSNIAAIEPSKIKFEQMNSDLFFPVEKIKNENFSTTKLLQPTRQKNTITNEQKEWIDNYALYNRPLAKNWNGKLSWQAYITPSLVYRKLYSNINAKYLANANFTGIRALNTDIENQVTHMPSFGVELGAGLQYSLLKWVKLNVGVQVNFTRYNTVAYENNHPVATTVTMIEENSSIPYDVRRATPYSRIYGVSPTRLHNETLQFSIPIGIDMRLAKYEKLEWYVGSSIQPTIVAGGKSYLISSDGLYYIKDKTLLNRVNLNAGFETYIAYKTNNKLTWKFGPEYRVQLFGTNNKTYSIGEHLVNYGFKFGVAKKF